MTALDDLRRFPPGAMRAAGYQLDRVQRGLLPTDWKPLASVGKGVAEIRLWEDAGTFRVVYIASLPEAVHVLHCFQKKSRETSTLDLAVITRRYKKLLKELRT